jgi:2-methylisocitrate lyase-like PEP mutase family enzyme
MTDSLDARARLFRSLHVAGDPLVLPNAWDVASARLVEQAGARAVATTSAGVAWSLGAPDGDRMSRDDALELIARIVHAVEVPVTADIESGYAPTADGVATTVEGVAAAGAVGVNLEDSLYTGEAPLRDVQEQCLRITAARRAADAAGVPLYVNARVDTYIRGVGEPEERPDHTVERAAAYLAAGADGIFVPKVTDQAVIGQLVERIAAPLNVLAAPGAPTVAELAALGVARVSLGPAIALAAYAVVRDAAREALTDGTYTAVNHRLEGGDLNALMPA